MSQTTVENAIIHGSIAVTPSDAVDVNERYAYGLYIETGGNLKVEYFDGTTDTFAIPDYSTIHMRFAKVHATGTTCTGIHALAFFSGPSA